MNPFGDTLDDTDDDDGLDTSWIQRETQLQNIQTNYARESMESIQGIFIYINQNNYIEKIVRENIALTINENVGSHLTTDMLLKIIQTKKLRTPVSKYKFSSIFTNIIDIEPDQIQSFSKTHDSELANIHFFKETAVTSLLELPASIFIFHPINALYFFFQEVLVEKHNQTLKSILKPSKINDNGEPDTTQKHNTTKKVRICDKQDEKVAYRKLMQKRGTRRRRM